MLEGRGFATPNPRPMFPNPPGLLRIERWSSTTFGGVLETLKELRPGDVFLTLGAGDVWKLGEEIRLKTGMLAESFQR